MTQTTLPSEVEKRFNHEFATLDNAFGSDCIPRVKQFLATELHLKDLENAEAVEARDKSWMDAIGVVEYCSIKFPDNERERNMCLGRNAIRGVVSIKMDVDFESEESLSQTEGVAPQKDI